jgi:dipeptidyl-peptidase 4
MKNSSANNEIQNRYDQARIFEQQSFTNTLVLNSCLYPKWIGTTECFIYLRETIDGKEYRFVDGLCASNQLAFDHCALAKSLARKIGQACNANNLPISDVDVSEYPDNFLFYAFDKKWRFDLHTGVCKTIDVPPSHWLVSPNGKRAVYIRGYNLWVRNLETGEERPLTDDGEKHYAYSVTPERVDLVGGIGVGLSFATPSPQALWSPDSGMIFTLQTDERQVQTLPVNVYVPEGKEVRPQCLQPRYALPGDEHIAEYRMLVIDVDTGYSVEAAYPRVLDVGDIGPFQRKRVWWSANSDKAYFVDMARGEKRARVVEFNPLSGDTKVLFEELSDTYIDLHFMNEELCTFMPLPDSHELIWWSERSGRAHLYLYDLNTGELKRTLTQGDWLVRDVLAFDPVRRDVFIQIAGRDAARDPYYREVCRVNIDSCDMTSLACSDHDYVVHKKDTFFLYALKYSGHDTDGAWGISPTGNYVVATRTRVDEAPVTELRDRNGCSVMVLEAADVSALPEGWQWPEPVKLKAADGKTDIYGVVFRPTYFDASEQYPVIDYAQCLPTIAIAPKGSFCSDTLSAVTYLTAAAWAELGFIVVIIDGRGTTFRDVEFHHSSYGRMHLASHLDDHIHGIRQLADRYSYMDTDRVGITGQGGCNAAAYGLLAYPDFYKVGTVVSAYDVRLALGFEIYQGSPQEGEYMGSVLGQLAGNLRGRLLLIHGMLDNFFHPAGMFQFVDALVQENKCFDMLMIPNGGHMWREGYALCRAWDYMVRYLRGSEPPEGFKLMAGKEFALRKMTEVASG